MNIYKKLSSLLPKSIAADLYGVKDFADNSLTMYSASWDRNRERPIDDKIFREAHRFIKAAGLLTNLADRKLADLQLAYLNQKAKFNPILKRNEDLKDKHKGRRCFILANGPSLNKQDLSPLAGEITIATNTFWKHPILSPEWQATYYFIVHVERFYEQPFLGDGFENPSFREVLSYFKSVREKMFGSRYVIPISGLPANKKYEFFPDEQTSYFSFLPYPICEHYPKWPNFVGGIPWVQDSSQCAIMLAMYMGCSQIILLGCDHDWFINYGEEKHFFEGPAFKDQPNKYDSSKNLMLDQMWFAWVLWRGHKNLRRLAEANNVEIINATGGGVLDVYPIKRYEDLVNG